MASDDDEYVPSDVDEEAFLQQAYATDEERYLAGATTGEEDEDEEGGELFGEGADPMALLAGMEAQGRLGRQPYEVLAQRTRRGRQTRQQQQHDAHEDEEEEQQEPGGGPAAPPLSAATASQPGAGRRRKGGIFGASVDEIWDDNLAEQLNMQPPRNRKKQRARKRWRKRAEQLGSKRRDVPEEVAARLGQANMLYATQQYQEATALLLEVVRLAPNLVDPYLTLSALHEEAGDTKKALDFSMIAAHLTPRELTLWRRNAQLSAELGLTHQAIYCYTQVLKRDKEDADARYDRAMLYADLEEHRRAIEGLEQVAALRPGHAEVPKALARLFHRTGQPNRATAVLQEHMSAHPDQSDLTHANILAELHCEAGQWGAALAVVQRAERDLLGPDEELPIDLRVKAGVAHANLGDIGAAVEAFGAILQEPAESFADLYHEAGSVLLGVGRPDQALPFLAALAEHPEVGSPEVWARLAQCHRALDDTQGALKAYETVVARLGPDHPGYVEAVVALADLHRELGQGAEAERVLAELEALIRSQDMPADRTAALHFVLRRANIFYACGKNDAYLDVTLPVLAATLRSLEAEHRAVAGEGDPRLAKRLKYLGERRGRGRGGDGDPEGVFVGYRRSDRRKAHVRELDQRAAAILAASEGGALSGAESEGEDEGGPSAFVMRELLHEEAPFTLLLQTGQVLLAERQHREARELLQAALDVCGKRWADRWKKDAVRLLLFEAALGLREFAAALGYLRPVAARWPHSPVVWNEFSRYLAETGGVKAANRLLHPLRHRHPTCVPLMLLLGHCHLLNTAYSDALSEYFHAYRTAPGEPLALLCIAAALANQAATRRVPDRHRAVLQAFAFLQEYSDARCNPQEAAYNIGRAAHHLGLLHIAVPYYQRALEAAPPLSGPAGDAYDLRREAAYNLSLIYRQSGADALAKRVLRVHLTV